MVFGSFHVVGPALALAWVILSAGRYGKRLKERLTGAAILVALIVLIVPEMFHGHARRARRPAGAAAARAPPMRSYTIDLGASIPRRCS